MHQKMNTYFKQLIGITLMISLMIQGMVMPYFTIAENIQSEESAELYSNSYVGEYAGDLLLVSGSDHLVIVASKGSLTGGDLFGNIYKSYIFHYENQIESIFKISQKVDLIFDIKELKFPTHYFW